MRFFNTAGPIKPELHYCLDPLGRFDLEEVLLLISQEKYFILHAPRQTGKTSTLLALARHLNAGDRFRCLYANIEAAQAMGNNIPQAMSTILSELHEQGRIQLNADFDAFGFRQSLREGDTGNALNTALSAWAGWADRPVVLLLDEVDALVGDTLVSVLRQIRSGYNHRPASFPQSIILCGVRDVRDYRIHSGGEIVTGGSAFNIKATSLRMGNFTRKETAALLAQHTTETGQEFEAPVYDGMWEDTMGQPWLVNALAYEAAWEDRAARDRSMPITLEGYRAARERLIASRATHLDQLTDKLREPRVHRVISALLAGENVSLDGAFISTDDQQYVEDLGLITTVPHVAIANRIYREIIPRELTWVAQTRIVQQPSWCLTPEHRLDMPALLTAFQQFFRENSEAWIERFDYREAGPQLLMQAFLQRVINGGGRIDREYGLGRGRTDLCLHWPLNPEKGFHGPVQRVVIELKIKRGRLEKLLPPALEQTAEYADRCRADESHLVIFDRSKSVSWKRKIWRRAETVQGMTIDVWGC